MLNLNKIIMKQKMQQIKREDLALFYNQVCEGWKHTIAKLNMEQSGLNISISEEMIIKAHTEANVEQKKLIEKYFKINKPKDITDKIKSWKDVLEYKKIKETDILPWKNANTDIKKSQNAFAKLQLIVEVLNEGWSPNWFNHSEYKYYPYFEKNKSGWVLRGVYGVVWSCFSVGLGLYFKNRKLAEHCVGYFIDEYKDFLG